MNHTSRYQRHRRARTRLTGSAARPRVSIFRSNRGVSIQLIDDNAHHTLVSVGGRPKKGETKLMQATSVAQEVAAAAKAAGITTVVFDRSGYRYHGRVKAVADALREGGLVF